MTALAPFQIAVIAAAIFVLSAAGLILLETERRRRLLTRAISVKNVEGVQRSQGFLQRVGASASRMAMVGQKEVEQTEKALIAAGYRTKAALYQLIGLRTVGLFVGVAGPLVWSQLAQPLAPLALLPACIGGALFGWRLPM